MRVRVVLEQVFQRTPDGAVVTGSSFHADFFRRYLTVFSAVEVVARVETVTAAAPGWRTVEADAITVRPLPAYRGLGGYLRRRSEVITAMRAAITGTDALILRVPSPLAGCVDRELTRAKRPYAVEVVGDPWDVFAPGAIRHRLRPLLRWHFRAQLRRQCAHAMTGCYVTGSALQRRYPLPTGARSIAASDVDLNDEAFIATGRLWESAPTRPRLLFVGTLAQLYKAPDVLITAVGLCARQGCVVDLDLVGDGAHRQELSQLAQKLGIADQVHFHGHVPAGPAVRQHLDRSDLFVLPSRQEGLPRALVEAMARGLPCIGSTVGGIPELLESTEMVPPNDAAALAALIISQVRDATWLTAASARNRQKASGYHRHLLDQRHRDFLTAVHDGTAVWAKSGT